MNNNTRLVKDCTEDSQGKEARMAVPDRYTPTALSAEGEQHNTDNTLLDDPDGQAILNEFRALVASSDGDLEDKLAELLSIKAYLDANNETNKENK